MARILKFNTDKAVENILSIEDEIEKIKKNIEQIVPYTIQWFTYLKEKYGKGRERRTKIRSFENIVAAKVAIRNEKLYVDRKEGFMGFGLKKDEYLCDCSDIDDVIVFPVSYTHLDGDIGLYVADVSHHLWHWDERLGRRYQDRGIGHGDGYRGCRAIDTIARHSFRPVRTVSYTHLDVYKRQASGCSICSTLRIRQ